MSPFAKWPLRVAAGLVAVLVASPAPAQLDKCQAGLTKSSQKLEMQLAKGLEKCLAAVRKGLVKNKPASAGAVACEKALDKLMGLGVVPFDKTRVGSFLAAVNKLGTQSVCTPGDLQRLGHMVSGTNAPGASPTDFVAAWLAVVKLHMAWKQHVADNGDAASLIEVALAAGPDGGNPSNCDAVKGTGCGTDCTGVPAAGYFYRPNLCALRPAVWPQCRLAACNLKATGATMQPVGAPVSVADRKFAVEVCSPPASGLPVTSPGYLMLAGGPAMTLRPALAIAGPPTVTWCVDQVRAEGWCDCTGNGIPYRPISCLDHNADPGGTCPDTGAARETGCVCTSPPGVACNTPGCTECRHLEGGAYCHPGTSVSALTTSYAGTSAANDCLLLATLQWRFLPPGTCVNAAGEALTTCGATIGSPTAACTALGGVSCVAAVGPDGMACTADDRPASVATVTIPFTTGMSTSTIEGYVFNAGSCTAGNVGMNCSTNDDCDTTMNSAGVCSAAVKGCGTGPNPEDCSFTTGLGLGPSSCAAMKAGLLANFALTGSVPVLENVPDPTLRDHIFTFKLDCE